MTRQQRDEFAQDVVDEFKTIKDDTTVIDDMVLYSVVLRTLTNYGLHE